MVGLFNNDVFIRIENVSFIVLNSVLTAMYLILSTSYIRYNVLSVQCIVDKAYIVTLAWGK